MACSITIDVNATIGYLISPGDPISSIHVMGTADGCEVVQVRLMSQTPSAQVSAEVINGAWTAIFNAPNDFNPADIPCGTQDIKVNAQCKDNAECNADSNILILNCQPRDCPPLASLIIFRNGDPSDLVNPADCLAPGVYTVRVIDPFSTTAIYQWSLNGLTQSAVSGAGQTEFDVNISEGGQAQSVSVIIFFSASCFLSSAVTLSPCDQPQPPDDDCPTSVALQVSQSGTQVPSIEDCLEPGTYTISVTHPIGPDISYSWSVDNLLQPGQSGNSLTLALQAGVTRSIQVSALQANCAPVPGSISLTACEDETRCPETVTLQVLDNQRMPVQIGEDCIAPGRYTVIVTNPTGAEVSYTWILNGQQQSGQAGRTFSFDLNPNANVEIAVSVSQPNCPEIRGQVILTGCPRRPSPCSDSITLIVTDGAGGRVQPDVGCLPAGRYQVQVESPIEAGVDYIWSVNGQVQAGETGQSIAIQLDTDQVVTISVSANQAECPSVPGGVTLRGCQRVPPPPPPPPWWCPVLLYSGLALLIIGLALIFGGFCSGNVPVIVTGGIMAVLGFGLLIAWALLCATAAGGCRLLRTVITLLSILAIIFGVVAAIFGLIAVICGFITSPTGIMALICALPGACGIGAVVDSVILGVLAAILTLIYFNLCE